MSDAQTRTLAAGLPAALMGLTRRSAPVMAARIAGVGAAFLLQLSLARMLGAPAFGVYVYATSWCLLLGMLTTLGYQSGTLRFLVQHDAGARPGRARGFLRLGWAVATLVGGSAAAAGVALLLAGDGGERTTALAVALVGVPFLTLINLNSGLAHGLSRFLLATLPRSVLRQAGMLVVVAALLAAGVTLDAPGAVTLYVAAAGAIALGQLVMVAGEARRRFGTATPEYEPALWTGTGIQLMIPTLFAGYFQELSTILTGWYLPAGDLGVFNVCFRLAGLIALFNLSFNMVGGADIARHHANNDLERMQRTALNASLMKSLFAVAGLAVLTVAGPTLLSLFGPDFTDGAVALLILGLAYLVIASAGQLLQVLSIVGAHLAALPVLLASLAVMAAGNAVLIPRYGLDGAAVSVLLTVLFWNALLSLLVRRHAGIDVSLAAAVRMLFKHR
ncbi:lipopolysaccharide biosynthesis protein [Azospirillum sp. ST 5-10]|uniref:lipopolysaccharide biosynthesis protein n=1 Tax=unclassified Azospirillum TaxID=2630922 RepID=UPI003F4A7F42